jgi:manganese efflux pump family protein
LLIIGFVSLAFSIVGSLLGIRFGKGVEKRLKPELLGGIVLIIIGIRVLCEHLFGL